MEDASALKKVLLENEKLNDLWPPGPEPELHGTKRNFAQKHKVFYFKGTVWSFLK